jgi:GT2 family glycosyltransferase
VSLVSIIVCSRTPTLPVALAESIATTVGCAFELIVVDNADNRYSIAQAYNVGIGRSAGEYLVFAHDDVRFVSPGWGPRLLELFAADARIGLVGVAGSTIKTRMPSAWWDCAPESLAINVVQHYPAGPAKQIETGFYRGPDVEVVVVDGVLMVARKDPGIRFNEALSGFHNYDLAISLEYRAHGYRVVVSRRILIEHLSIGTTDSRWTASSMAFHRLYRRQLPATVAGNATTSAQEVLAGTEFVKRCVQCGDIGNGARI